MDEGLLTGLAEAVKSGYGEFRDVRRAAEEKAMRDRMARLQLAQSGMVESPDGQFSKGPDLVEDKDLSRRKTEAEIGKLEAEAKMKGEGLGLLDREHKMLMNEKMRKEIAEGKKPSTGEFDAAGYAKRLEQAEDVFKGVQEAGYDPTSVKSMMYSKLPGFLSGLKPEQLQLQEQAQRNFVNAVLRRESGAAISPSEFDSAEKQYFPKQGDSPEVLRQKEINRQLVYRNLRAAAGKAFEKTPSVSSIAGGIPKRGKQGLIEDAMASEAVTMPKVGYIKAGYEFTGGDPKDKRSWRKVD